MTFFKALSQELKSGRDFLELCKSLDEAARRFGGSTPEVVVGGFKGLVGTTTDGVARIGLPAALGNQNLEP